MTLFSGKNKATFSAATLLVVAFLLFNITINEAQAWAGGADSYNKAVGGTLSSTNWNNLPTDFLNRSGAANMTGPLTIGTASPLVGGLTVHGPVSLSLPASNIAAGEFGSATGGGDYIFSVSNSDGNVGIGTSTVNYKLSVQGDINFTGSLLNNGTPFTGSRWGLNGTSIYYNTGNVGIGTTNPQFKIHGSADGVNIAAGLLSGTAPTIGVSGQNSNVNIGVVGASNAAATRPLFQFIRSRGALDTPLVVQNNDNMGDVLFGGYDGTAVQYGAGLFAFVDGFPSSGNVPARLSFVTGSNSGNRTERLTIKNDGNVGIGTTTPLTPLHVYNGAVSINKGSAVSSGSALTVGRNDAFAHAAIIRATNHSDTTYPIFFARGSSGTGNGIYHFLGENSSDVRVFSTDYSGNAYFAGNVGIGTTTPARKLHVAGTALFDQLAEGMTPGASQKAAFTTVEYVDTILLGTTTVPTTVGYWASNGSNISNVNSGNVGIGTTAPSGKLEIYGAGPQMIISGGVGVDLSLNFDEENSETINSKISHKASDNSLGFWTNGGTLTEKMTILSGGNVGIGTSNPEVKLTLQQADQAYVQPGSTSTWDMAFGIAANTSKISGMDFKNFNSSGQVRLMARNDANDYVVLNAMGTTASASFFGQAGNQLLLFGVGKRLAIGTNTADPLILGTSNIERMRIDSSGNVGIGTTTPIRLLHVAGAAQFDQRSFGVSPGTTELLALTTVEYVNGMVSGVGTSTVGYWSINGSNISNVNSGNVGVGMTNPQTKTHIWSGEAGAGSQEVLRLEGNWVSNPSGPMLRFTNQHNSGTNPNAGEYNLASIIAKDDTGSWGGSLYFQTTPVGSTGGGTLTDRMVIQSGGNVGIGTTAPSQQLQITQNFRLPSTSGTTPYGIIYKGTSRFIHDFSYGVNGNGVTPSGLNTFVGVEAGNLTMGSTATTVDQASYNTGIGYQSLRGNTTGYHNSAIGYASLYANTTGYYNSAMGNYSLFSNNTGYQNSAIGYQSLLYNTTGYNNSVVGGYSLYSNTTGYNNSAVGLNAGRYLANGTTGRVTGNNGLYLGYDTRASADGTTNEIVIGAGAIGKGSNAATYGNASMLKHIFEAGNVGIGTTTPIRLLHVAGAAQFDQRSFGVSPGTTELLALTTVEYVNGMVSGVGTSTVGYWSINGSNIYNSNSGNVGIGTSAPGTNKLLVQGKLAVNGAFEGFGSSNDNFFAGKLGVNNSTVGASSLAVFGNTSIGEGYLSSAAPTNGLLVEGRVGIGTSLPAATEALHVNGNTRIDGGLLLNGNLTMAGHTLTVDKITANTIDPLYTIKGTKYSTFASSIVGGVKEEYVGRVLALNFKRNLDEYEYVIDLAKVKEESDLWVWYQIVDFTEDNVEIFLTPQSRASIYAFVRGTQIIVRSDKPVDASLRLVGKRYDWQSWPTKAVDQNQSGGLVLE